GIAVPGHRESGLPAELGHLGAGKRERECAEDSAARPPLCGLWAGVYSRSRKKGSTVPFRRIVIGLPKRSRLLPAATRIQPSLTQYSSTLVFSVPLKRMPTPRSSRASS